MVRSKIVYNLLLLGFHSDTSKPAHSTACNSHLVK